MPPAKRPPSKHASGRAATKRAAPLVHTLAEAAWTEADSALAEALVECGRAGEANSKKERAEALALLSLALGVRPGAGGLPGSANKGRSMITIPSGMI